MKSYTSLVEQAPFILDSLLILWDETEANKYATWFYLHGASHAVHDEDQELAAELVFLRDLWAEKRGFGA